MTLLTTGYLSPTMLLVPAMNKQIWIGFAEVRPLPECKLLEEARGAYVHIMAWAETAEEFQKMASLRDADLSLEIVQFRDTQPRGRSAIPPRNFAPNFSRWKHASAPIFTALHLGDSTRG
jgi:hypothetical protein